MIFSLLAWVMPLFTTNLFNKCKRRTNIAVLNKQSVEDETAIFNNDIGIKKYTEYSFILHIFTFVIGRSFNVSIVIPFCYKLHSSQKVLINWTLRKSQRLCRCNFQVQRKGYCVVYLVFSLSAHPILIKIQ